MAKKPFNMSLEEETIEKIKKLAEREKRSPSNYIETLIEKLYSSN